MIYIQATLYFCQLQEIYSKRDEKYCSQIEQLLNMRTLYFISKSSAADVPKCVFIIRFFSILSVEWEVNFGKYDLVTNEAELLLST